MRSKPYVSSAHMGSQIHSAALLKISELRDLEAIEHYLPAHAPRTARRPLPVILFELKVVLLQIDSDRFERFEIQLLHVHRRRLQNQLKLGVLEQPVRILAIAAVGRPARGLHVTHPVGLRTQYAQKGFRRHGSRADFNVIGLLQNASALRPEGLQAENNLLKRHRIGIGWGRQLLRRTRINR